MQAEDKIREEVKRQLTQKVPNDNSEDQGRAYVV
jgi:hypothetical protein